VADLADVDRTVIRLVTDAPFYGHVAVALRKSLGDGARTLTADGPAIMLQLGGEEWDLRSPQQRVGLFKHELLHLVFGHPFMRRDYGDKSRFDVASDLVVSQLLLEDERHESELTLRDFEHLALRPDQSVGYYYEHLAQDAEAERDGEGEGSSTAEGVGAAAAASKEPMHDGWDAIDASPGFERTLMETAIESLMEDLFERSTSASWGPLPLAVRRRLGELIARRPTLDWRRVLRLFGATAQSTSLRNTVHRRSKRYGTVPGTKIQPHRRLAVVLDTSGSVSAEDLASFMSEVHHIWRAGAEVTVVCADAAVNQVFPYQGLTPSSVGGGGGTSFEPAILLANEKLRPDGLVYLTDGYAPAPRTKPRYPMLWLITRNGAPPTSPDVAEFPGRRVWMT
jgi:predicted metal-dependent peptidase